MLDVSRILDIHRDCTVRWHHEPLSHDLPVGTVDRLVSEQHSFNFQLWHQEDIARNPKVSDQRLAQAKRSINTLNERRSHWIEKIDVWIAEDLERRGVAKPARAPQNTETVGGAIDRLSVLSLRLYHLDERAQGSDLAAGQVANLNHQIAVCLGQQRDLSRALTDLARAIYAGQQRHVVFRKFRIYDSSPVDVAPVVRLRAG